MTGTRLKCGYKWQIERLSYDNFSSIFCNANAKVALLRGSNASWSENNTLWCWKDCFSKGGVCERMRDKAREKHWLFHYSCGSCHSGAFCGLRDWLKFFELHQLTKVGVWNKLFNFLRSQTDFEHVRELAAFELNSKCHMAMQNKVWSETKLFRLRCCFENLLNLHFYV